MKMKRIAATGVALMMSATMLTACGGQTQSSSQASATASGAQSEQSTEQTTINVAFWDATTNYAESNAFEAFEKANPNIKINLIDVPSTDYETKLNTMLNGGADLDVYFVKQYNHLKDYYDKGQALDLTPYIERDGIDLTEYNSTADPFMLDGKQYALPLRTDFHVLYYNKDLFDAKGKEYPTNDMTWAEFEALAGEMTDETNYGAYIHTWQSIIWNLAFQDGKHILSDYETGYDYAKPGYDMVVRMQEAGQIQDYGQLKSGNIHYSGAFINGNVAMMPMGTWFITTLRERSETGEVDFDWGVVMLPHPEGVEAGYTLGSSTPLAINTASKNPDAAWEFVKFMTGEEGAVALAEYGAIPARADAATIEKLAQLDGMPEGLIDALQFKNIAVDRPVQAEHLAEIDQIMGEQHSMIMLGECTVDEGLAEITRQVKEIFE